jgi:multiple sugar transport system substrate-binding protein
LVIDDPALAAGIERVWRAKSEAPLEVRQATSQDLANLSRPDADAVIYPSALLGELAERGWLFPLTEEMQEDSDLNQHDVLDMLRLREVRWGEEAYAVSFGSPVLLVAYRADIFEQAGLAPPATWEEYDRAAKRLAQREGLDGLAPAESGAWRAVAEPWGPGWAAQTFLARAAPYVRHHDQYSDLFDFTTMKPLIDAPPFVRALEEMVAMVDAASPDSMQFSPHDAYREIVAGKTGMALCWPPAAQAEPEKDTKPDQGSTVEPNANSGGQEKTPQENGLATPTIRWAEAPGSAEAYNASSGKWEKRSEQEPQRIPLLTIAGRLGSVTRESGRSKAAFHVLALLSGTWSRDVATQSRATTLFRESHVASPGDWYPEGADAGAAQSYAEAAEQSLSRGVWMFSPRIPGRDRYLAALDEAVRQALGKNASPQDALRNAAEQWQEITKELGETKQADAYQRNLGLEP